MRLLLDTHTLLWFLTADPRLSLRARTALIDPGNERWLSPISLLEIALKIRIGKLTLHAPFRALFPAQLVANQIQLWPLTPEPLELLTHLPLYHRDPFDRLLAATTLTDQMILVSADSVFDAYGLNRLW